MARTQLLRALLAAALVAAAVSQEAAPPAEEDFQCPADEPTGKFADSIFCDAYWSCFKGEAKFIECADGLAFNPSRVLTQKEPCDNLVNVDCTGREELGEPQGTGVCERKNGYFVHEDPNVCDKYYSCKDDTPTLQLCPPGLHFRTDTLTCDWPAAAKRGDCVVKQKLQDGFTCDPSVDYFTPANQKIAHPTFPHDSDCRLFYTCLNGVKPQISQCTYGLVYNIENSKCDTPDKVPECLDYYKEDEGKEVVGDDNV